MRNSNPNARSIPRKCLFRISIALLILFCSTDLLYSKHKPDSLFMSDDIIKLELRADFKTLQLKQADTPSYYDGELIYFMPNGKSMKFSVKVMARGHFRRNPDICSFPPLWVDFKRKEVENTLFDDQDKLKLVTPCQGEEDVIEEYTIYKMYNAVTNYSMKARLARILYYDTGTDRQLFEKYSFFLEDRDHLARRNEAETRDRFLTPFDLNRENFMKMAIFEYLIGNKDWYVSSRKNVIILQPKDTSLALVAVPYDFDFAGLVDASYTKPEGVPDYVLSPRRIYKGLCYTEEEFRVTFDFYRNLMPVFDSIINNQNLISKYTKKQMLKYIDNFNNITANKALFKKEFLDACETRKKYNLPDKPG